MKNKMKKTLMSFCLFLCIATISQIANAGWSFHYVMEDTNRGLVVISDQSKQKCVKEVGDYKAFSTGTMERMILVGAYCQDVSKGDLPFQKISPHTILCAINGKQAIFVHWFENEKKCRIANMKNLFKQLSE